MPSDIVDNERRIAEETAKSEGKPEQALPKIVEGRLNGYFKDVVLLDQPSVSDSKKTVKALLDEAGVTVTRFVRFEVGQGSPHHNEVPAPLVVAGILCWYRRRVNRVSAFDFGDDALGDLDAVGLVEALRVRQGHGFGTRRGRDRPHRGGEPQLNGLAYEASTAPANAQGSPARTAGTSTASRPSSRTTWKSLPCRRCMAPTHGIQGPRRSTAGSRASSCPPALCPRQDADVGVRLQRFGRTSEVGAVRNPWNPSARRRVVIGGGRVRRGRRGADRARQRRRRVDPNTGGGQRTRRPQADQGQASLSMSRPPACRAPRRERRPDPLGARHRCVLREAERAYLNSKLPPIGDVSRPGRQRLRIAFCTKSIVREASPEMRELTLKTAALLEDSVTR